jgi:hypothetical protein
LPSALLDDQLTATLDRKLYYDRLAQDNVFNYVTASAENGVVTLSGETRNEFDRDSALSLVNNTTGVKDVIDNIKVARGLSKVLLPRRQLGCTTLGKNAPRLDQVDRCKNGIPADWDPHWCRLQGEIRDRN